MAVHEIPPWLLPLAGMLVSLIGTLLVLLARSTLGGIRANTSALGDQLDGIEKEFRIRLDRFEAAVSAIAREVGAHGAAIDGLAATLDDLKGSLGRMEDSLQEVTSRVGDHAESLAEGGVLFREIRERIAQLEEKLANVVEKGCAQARFCRPTRPGDSQP